ncbi:2-ketogluconate reductase [Andreprevotia sp. IGB-42]|uniref:2-hydroxyacid dehydrogenase n=1 Tax=Andreprevotia sp. IGB-42 TaxID=2497473 RepID=UPI00135B1492|nr:2-hydroxyacid dehydrogenase [Andreprevotia sp. IGB-42]KAF0813042.1 2-ketogluconate reductase [Andreprevotia sp. IGB-42]
MTTSSSRPTVLVTTPLLPSLQVAVERDFIVLKLWEASDRNALLAEHATAVRAVVTTSFVGADAALIAALPALEIIASFGVGYDSIDIAAAQAHGVAVTNTPGVLCDGVADCALALLLAVSHRICEADRFVRAGRWPQQGFGLGRSPAGKTCGIVGMGGIGRAVATRAAAFGMRIAYQGPRRKADLDYAYHADLADLAAASDYLVLALPGGAETRHTVDATVLAALGAQGVLINVARGSVVDEAALVAALQQGVIAGAGLDVFEDEPNVPAALLGMDNVVLLPHIGSATEETRQAMGELTFANLTAWAQRQTLLTRVV